MGIGSITFSLPHFLSGSHHTTSLSQGPNSSMSNICKSNRYLGVNKAKTSAEEGFLMSLPGLEKLKSQIEGNSMQSIQQFCYQFMALTECYPLIPISFVKWVEPFYVTIFNSFSTSWQTKRNILFKIFNSFLDRFVYNVYTIEHTFLKLMTRAVQVSR